VARREVTVRGREVHLTPTEYKLLLALADRPGQVLTQDQLLERVWGPAYVGESEYVRTYIRHLRRKLGDDARAPRYILTEPGVGYRLRRPGP